ncbi:iron-containing redox enzyme family protein [Dactylosporangium salmoneum]|uniref:Iron-containing redox enzyme family protein n=1 Tax=Dactylosporangium salmoneum TaxID=53361 RepID=A0ABN3H722_9ACTN
MRLPEPRGPLSGTVLDALAGAASALPARLPASGDPLADEDLQLALHVCFELHYRGLDGVDGRWARDPGLVALRLAAQERFGAALRRLVPVPAPVPAREVPRALEALVEADDGPSLSAYLARRATIEQFREFVMHRSIYHQRGAAPVEIQAGGYGGGRPGRVHAGLFRTTMRELGLDTAHGAYLGRVPAVTLAAGNLMSLFGLHRRLRGALLGHLAAHGMTSPLPNRRYGDGLRRLGGGRDATRFYDKHAEAGAAPDLCGAFCAAEPGQSAAVLWGAACALALDARFAEHLLDSWAGGGSSLRPQLPSARRVPAGAPGA